MKQYTPYTTVFNEEYLTNPTLDMAHLKQYRPYPFEGDWYDESYSMDGFFKTLAAAGEIYEKEVYKVDYIDSILKEFNDHSFRNFSFSKVFTPIVRTINGNSDKKFITTYVWTFNDRIVISCSPDNIYSLDGQYLYLKGKDKLYYSELLDEARKKIVSKYNQYLIALEERLEISIAELLETG